MNPAPGSAPMGSLTITASAETVLGRKNGTDKKCYESR
jgi:hypothetical protein